MVVTDYEIPFLKNTYDFVSNYPNRLQMNVSDGMISFSIDHLNTLDELLFQSELSRRMGIKIGSNSFQNICRFIDEIKTDQLLYVSARQVILNNIGITFKNLFSDFNGRSFFSDLTGFTKMAFQTFWNKNGGTGQHHLKIIDSSGIIPTPLINTEDLGGGNGLAGGNSDNALSNYTIPITYENFKGKLRIQVRSTVDTDSPIFEGINIYLRR